MPAIIAAVSQKGGVSKSTISRALAIEAARAGLSVRVGDLDAAQRSTSDWHADREAANLEPAISTQVYRTAAAAISDAEKVAGLDLLVLDGPAKADAETLAIARAANLVLLPTGAGLDDLRPAVRVANGLVAKGIPAGRLLFVLSRIGTEAEAQAARSYLQSAGYLVANGYVPERPAYRAAQNGGQAITEVRFEGLRKAAETVIQSIIDAAMQAAEVTETV